MGNFPSVLVVSANAFLDESTEIFVEGRKFLGILLFLALEEVDDFEHEGLANLLNERGVLHVLTADVKRNIFAIDDTLDETKPVGQNFSRFWLDQNTPRIDTHTWLQSAETNLLRMRPRYLKV